METIVTFDRIDFKMLKPIYVPMESPEHVEQLLNEGYLKPTVDGNKAVTTIAVTSKFMYKGKLYKPKSYVATRKGKYRFVRLAEVTHGKKYLFGLAEDFELLQLKSIDGNVLCFVNDYLNENPSLENIEQDLIDLTMDILVNLYEYGFDFDIITKLETIRVKANSAELIVHEDRLKINAGPVITPVAYRNINEIMIYADDTGYELIKLIKGYFIKTLAGKIKLFNNPY